MVPPESKHAEVGDFMKQIPLVRRVVLEPAVSYLSGQGIPVEHYLHRAKIATPESAAPDSLIPLHQLCVFLNSVSRAEGIPDLGFHITGRQGIESLGLYGQLVMQSLTLHDFIQTSMEFIASYNSGIRIWIERQGEEVRYCQQYDESLPPRLLTEVVHLGLANALSHAKLVLGENFRPRRIELPTAPADLMEHFPHLENQNLTLRFNQSHTAVSFDRRLLSLPLSAPSEPVPLSGDSVERRSFFESGPSSTLARQLEQVIESTLGHAEQGLQMTAAIIGTSPRTLQRRLSQEQLAYGRLLQSVRFRSAQRLLRDPAMRLAEIARRLGYTDSANFIRAFKRWSGIGPSEFRQLHLHDQHE